MNLEGGVSVDTLEGSVLTLVIDNLHRDAEFIAIDEQANHDIVPLGGFGEADRLAHQAPPPVFTSCLDSRITLPGAALRRVVSFAIVAAERGDIRAQARARDKYSQNYTAKSGHSP